MRGKACKAHILRDDNLAGTVGYSNRTKPVGAVFNRFFYRGLGFDFRNPASSMLVSYDKNHRKCLPFGKINVQQRKHPVQLSVHILGLGGLFGVNESQ